MNHMREFLISLVLLGASHIFGVATPSVGVERIKILLKSDCISGDFSSDAHDFMKKAWF
jgi:hypothetical protein